MDSYEINKLIGALLATVFVVLSAGIISDSIFAAPVPASPGFLIEAVEPVEAGAGDQAPAEASIAVLLASANPEAGAAVFKKCGACHTGEKGGANKIGPNLFGVVNRPVASHQGYAYSAAMKAFSEGGKVVWDYDHLDHFLAAPKALVKGTAMAFAGVKKTDERANLIAYLRTLADTPEPLPETTAPAPENASAPAEGAAPAESAPAEGAAPAQPAPAEGAAPAHPAPAEGAAPAPAAPAPAPAQ
jgi:cytochrome c